MMAREEGKLEFPGHERIPGGNLSPVGQLDTVSGTPCYFIPFRIGEPGLRPAPWEVGNPVRQEVHPHVRREIAETVGIPLAVLGVKLHLRGISLLRLCPSVCLPIEIGSGRCNSISARGSR